MPGRAKKRPAEKAQLARSSSMPRDSEDERIDGALSLSKAEGKKVSWMLNHQIAVINDEEQGTIDLVESDSKYVQTCESAGVQHYGPLWKKISAGKGVVRWSPRFCVIKEGFLFYYSEGEAKDFEEKREFNQHPRGVIPVGRAEISACKEIGHSYCISICQHGSTSTIIFDCKSSDAQDLWVFALKNASSITLENAELGESMIRELEDQGLRLHREKQQYIDKLNSEMQALQRETEKNQLLEKHKAKLMEDKMKLEADTATLEQQMNDVKNDLNTAYKTRSLLEKEKINLSDTNESLQRNLQLLNEEKSKILSKLELKAKDEEKLSLENRTLSETTETLKQQLTQIEQTTTELTDEKRDIEARMLANMERAAELENEKESYHRHAQELIDILRNLSLQKDQMEKALKEEICARLQAESDLQNAEAVFSNLKLALSENPSHFRHLEGHFPDVQNLREYFEKCAYEARIEANRAMILKNALIKQKLWLRQKKDNDKQGLEKRNSYTMTGRQALEELV